MGSPCVNGVRESMTVIAVLRPADSEYEHAPSVSRYDGDHAPFGYAGFVVDECTVVCPECHDVEEDSTDSPIFGNEEADYPGLFCEGCSRPLATNLLVYESGPGSHLADDLPEGAIRLGGDS